MFTEKNTKYSIGEDCCCLGKLDFVFITLGSTNKAPRVFLFKEDEK